MKKLISLVCVLALALAVCVPAFADDAIEPATAGQVVDSMTDQVASNPADAAAAASLNDALKEATNVYVDSNITAAMTNALFTALDNGTAGYYDFTEGESYDCSIIAASSSDMTTKVDVVAENYLTLQVSFDDGSQSPLGAYVTVRVPSAEMQLRNDYRWRNEDGQTGYVSAYKFEDEPEWVYFSFFAPHFSVYVIEQNVNTSSPAPAASSSNSGSILARTDADLNMTAVVLAVLALALAAGCAVVLKKRALNK